MKGPIELLADIRLKVLELASSAGSQGTGAAYNPPTGGSGQVGYLSGIFKAIKGTLETRNVLRDSTGAFTFCPDECAESWTYNPDGTTATYTLTDNMGGQYRQTYGYDANGRQISTSLWIKQ